MFFIHRESFPIKTGNFGFLGTKKAVGVPTTYFVSRCAVVRFSLGQYFFSSRRSGLFRLFFVEI